MSELEILKRDYPNLMKLFDDEDLDERRYFVVIDPNIEEEADEADVFDPTEYNWMIFFPERVKEVLGDELFGTLFSEIESLEIIEDILDDGDDLFGVLSKSDEEQISNQVMQILDKLALKRLEDIS